MSAVERFVANQGVLSHYIALSKQEDPTASPYHASLQISSSGDFYLQERGSGAAQVCYYVKNFFTRLRFEGVCYFLSATPPSSAKKVQRLVDSLEIQFDKALEEVTESCRHLSYLGLTDEEMKQKGTEKGFFFAHIRYIAPHWRYFLFRHMKSHPVVKVSEALGDVLGTLKKLPKASDVGTLKPFSRDPGALDRLDKLKPHITDIKTAWESSLDWKNLEGIREFGYKLFVALSLVPSARSASPHNRNGAQGSAS